MTCLLAVGPPQTSWRDPASSERLVSQLSLKTHSPATLAGAQPVPRRIGRKWLRWLLAALIAAGGLAAWSRTSHFGWFARRAVALAYDVYDPLTRKSAVPMGLRLPDLAETPSDIADQLKARFPGHRVAISVSGGDQPNLDRVI